MGAGSRRRPGPGVKVGAGVRSRLATGVPPGEGGAGVGSRLPMGVLTEEGGAGVEVALTTGVSA